MAIEKAFEHLKLSALEVKALLIDIDEHIQPTVDEVETINEKLQELAEHIAVYKYLKGLKELSPSFGIHLKVMEADKTEEKKEPVTQEKKETGSTIVPKTTPIEFRRLEFNLNDKFRIINELFKQSSTEFNLAIEQINLFTSFDTSKAYLDELRKLYSWKEDHEMVVKLYQLNQKRFQ
jgi:hypothetical protein